MLDRTAVASLDRVARRRGGISVPKLWNWTSALTHMTNRRALQALTLAAVAAISIALPALGGSSASILRAQNGPPPLHAHTHHAIPLNGSVPRALQKAKRTGV